MNAKLLLPFGVFVSNGEVFICDTCNNCIRKVLRDGQIVTITRKDDGVHLPTFVVVSSSNQVYFSECSHYIRKIDQNGIVSVVAGTGVDGYNGDNQLAVHAHLSEPRGLFVTDDDEVFFCDKNNHRVRKIDRNGIITTIAGTGHRGYNGDGILAQNFSNTIVFRIGNVNFILVHENTSRKVLQNGMITTIAGTVIGYDKDGQPALITSLNRPYGLFIYNDQVYFSEQYNHYVRKILPNGTIKTIAGSDNFGYSGDGEPATKTHIECPTGIFVDDSGVYIACNDVSMVRKVDKNGIMTTVAGTGEKGYSGDVPFDFKKYPHIGPRKKTTIKPFPKSFYDLVVHVNSHHDEEETIGTCYEPLHKKVKF